MLKKYDKILYEVLIDKTSANKESLEPIAKKAEDLGQGFKQTLIEEGLFTEKNILLLLAENLGVEYYNLHEIIPNEEVISKVPVKIASYYKFFPLNIKERVLTVIVSYPLDINIQDEIRTQLGYSIEIGLSCLADILEGINKFYGVATQTLEGIDSNQSQKSELPSGDSSDDIVEDIEKLAGAASVINLVNQIIVDGWKKRASDIHIEPYRNKSFIRYRIDGILYDTHVSDKISKFLRSIISRIKIMSSLNIVERRLPQDGRCVVKVQGESLDLRISTIPTPFGESLVIRILPTKRIFGLEKLGFSTKDFQTLMTIIKKPNGIIFVTGPTGSGKTTTLYSCLNEINTKVRKVITIEDPIEYEMTGITQMQIMPQIGLTFSQGLRSILRHDPDVIMLGEVRDLETA
ncbi:MAG: type II/IV secretion system protein, partial [Candidatus Omnitrophica bacterium]|nr:type II/IV secretion system protein [Candidatus Omnitrophota bacterium]